MFAQSMNPRGSLSECRADRLSPIARARHMLGTRFKYIKHIDRTSFDDLSTQDAILALRGEALGGQASRRLCGLRRG